VFPRGQHSPKRRGDDQVQAEEFHDSIRPGLIAMLPRLKRFAGLMVGARREGTALLGRALQRMLVEQHRYQRGTALDRWAFAELYRHWLNEPRGHADPMGQAKTDDASFELLFDKEGGAEVDGLTAGFLGNLPPQQRLTLLLVYGERFDHIDAGRVLDVPADTIGVRLVRNSAPLADRLSSRALTPSGAAIETLYPEGPSKGPS
jgi:DNA-directed RNA polymerase specialized sigma24 family protein